VDFVARSLLSMSNYFILQLNRELGVTIDSDAFLGAFTMVDGGGQRVKVGPWHLGPGHRPRQPPCQSATLPTDYQLVDQEEIRISQYNKWDKYYRHAARHIPYAVCKANGASSLGRENVDEERGFEIGGIGDGEPETGVDDGETEIEEHLGMRPGGRPLNGKHDHAQDKTNTTYIHIYG
jgi:hypothetical protein